MRGESLPRRVKFDPNQPRDENGRFAGGGAVTETPEFKSWFKDSKVVKDDGKPLVVYHGTGSVFQRFDSGSVGSENDYGYTGHGFYFMDDPEWASGYAEVTESETQNVKAVYLRIERPLYIDNYSELERFVPGYNGATADRETALALTREIQKAGYDGVITKGKPTEYLVFAPNQIKSATGNSGTFDNSDPDITKSSLEKRRKATSASEYAEQLKDEYGVDAHAMGIATEMPEWLLEAAKDRLDETFLEDYWLSVNDVTATEIEYAIAEGIEAGLTMHEIAEQIGEVAPQYAGYRAMNVARTEVGNAMNAGHEASIRQINEETGMDFGKEWVSVCGTTTREVHCDLDGHSVALDDTFDLDGHPARWPGDELLPPEHRCNCQCVPAGTLVSVEGALLAASKMFYDGPLVELVTASGRRLQVTPNHPVLTTGGWVPAGDVKAGMYVLSKGVAVDVAFGENKQHEPTAIEDVFQSLATIAASVERCRRLAFQFHGDAQYGQGEIEAVVADVKLPLPATAKSGKDGRESRLVFGTRELSCSASFGRLPGAACFPGNELGVAGTTKDTVLCEDSLDARARHPERISDGGLGSASDISSDHGLLIIDASPAKVTSSAHRLGMGSNLDAGRMQSALNGTAVTAKQFGDLSARLSLVDVQPDQIVEANVVPRFTGHVYDLQTTKGMYSASGIIVHNCTLISGMVADEIAGDDGRTEDEDLWRIDESQEIEPYLGMRRLSGLIRLKWDEADHPRDDNGRFSSSGGSSDGGSDEHSGSGDKPAKPSNAVSVRDDGGVGGGSPRVGQAGKADPVSSEPLKGSPREANVPGVGKIKIEPFVRARQAAADYMAKTGLKYDPPKEYAKVDKERAKRIAAEYDAMPHAPNDPDVKEAYAALAKETIAQYEAALEAGLKVDFIDMAKGDPYAKSPRLAIEDIKNNNHMSVFATSDGFGSSQDFDPSENPLLAESGHTINGRPALVNDLFRIVHDYFGHAKEGNGMRADGEENAWRSHAAMFTDKARRAMTTETRGQNSWVNFGPNSESNLTATPDKTIFADQKTGLLPEWVMNEGAKSAGIIIGKSWNEDDHPRDALGRWTSGGETIDGDPTGEAGDDGIPHDNEDQEYLGFDDGKREPRDPLKLRDDASKPIAQRQATAVRRAEALVDQAIESGESVSNVVSWDSLDDSDKEDAATSYQDDHFGGIVDTLTQEWEDELLESAKSDAESWVAEDTDGAAYWLTEQIEEHGYDPDSIKVTSVGDDHLIVDHDSLQWLEPDKHEGKDPGDTYANDYEDDVDSQWASQYEDRVKERADELYNEAHEEQEEEKKEEFLQQAMEKASEDFYSLDEEEKLKYAGVSETDATIEHPDEYDPVGDPDNPQADNYVKTRAVVRFLQTKVMEQELESRGVQGFEKVVAENVATDLWSDWKGSSTSENGLLLQLATARELGGNLAAWEPERYAKAIKAAKMLSRKHGGGDVESLDGTQLDNDQFHVERGLKIAEAHVHGTWAASQFAMEKAGMSEMPVYRAIIVEKSSLENEKKEDVVVESRGGPKTYTKLTDIDILRNGAASATSDVSITNSWGGVGVSHIKEPTRIVIRIQAPRESILSLPAFGQNVHSEREVVIAGTNDWKAWDAFIDRAPEAAKVKIKAVQSI